MKDLRLLEIELFSYCNRKCKWCPNKTIDRTFYKELDEDIFKNIIQDLKENEYKGVITFSRYNEPLSHIDVFKDRLNYIRENISNKLVTNTNGDFLTNENLDGLNIDELSVMDYENKGLDWCKERLESLGCEIYKIQGDYIYANRGNMKIMYCVNWQANRFITDRGGYLKEYSGEVRNFGCNEPKYFVGINYDGTVSPCCNVRNDIEQHKDWILGDLHEQSLSDILKSEKRQQMIKDIAAGIWDESSPCYTCLNMGGRYTHDNGSIEYKEEDKHRRSGENE